MTAPGFHAPVAAITKCGGSVGGMHGKADEIKNKVSQAEVPEISWGLLGLATTYHSYKDMLGKFKTHLDEISKNLAEAGEKITAAGKAYTEHDDIGRAEMEKILGQMGKGTKA